MHGQLKRLATNSDIGKSDKGRVTRFLHRLSELSIACLHHRLRQQTDTLSRSSDRTQCSMVLLWLWWGGRCYFDCTHQPP